MEILLKVLGVLALVLIVGLALTYPIMLLINYVFDPVFLTAVFGIAQIGFWKTYCLTLVTGLLFRSSTK
jgi:hypothetical protein